MSTLISARVPGFGTAAWPLLVALVLGLAACGPGQAPEQSTTVAAPPAPEARPVEESRVVPPAPAEATPPLDVAPLEPAAVSVPKAAIGTKAASGSPGHRLDGVGGDTVRSPIHARISVVHGAAVARPGGDPSAAAPPGPMPESAVLAVRMARPGAHPDLASYVARVSASDHIELPGAQGMLSVWIGSPQNLPQEDSGTASSTQSLGMRGQTATVTPFAPDFEVSPASTVCERVVSSGSIVRFVLTPKHSGDLTVGANVQLFDSADCSGIPVPKSTSLLRVQVRVCKLCYVRSGLASMGQAAWSAFSHFWTWLLGVVFVTAALLINRWRRRKFHISKDDQV